MDKNFFPYGTKSKDFLIKRTIYLCKYLFDKGVDEIILACNTLSIVALEDVKPIFNKPIKGVIELFNINNKSKGLFIGTTNTINEMKKKYINLDYFDGTELIELIENNKDYKAYIDKKKDIFNKYPKIYLGCTHFIKAKYLFNNYISQDECYLQSK